MGPNSHVIRLTTRAGTRLWWDGAGFQSDRAKAYPMPLAQGRIKVMQLLTEHTSRGWGSDFELLEA